MQRRRNSSALALELHLFLYEALDIISLTDSVSLYLAEGEIVRLGDVDVHIPADGTGCALEPDGVVSGWSTVILGTLPVPNMLQVELRLRRRCEISKLHNEVVQTEFYKANSNSLLYQHMYTALHYIRRWHFDYFWTTIRWEDGLF